LKPVCGLLLLDLDNIFNQRIQFCYKNLLIFTTITISIVAETQETGQGQGTEKGKNTLQLL